MPKYRRKAGEPVEDAKPEADPAADWRFTAQCPICKARSEWDRHGKPVGWPDPPGPPERFLDIMREFARQMDPDYTRGVVTAEGVYE